MSTPENSTSQPALTGSSKPTNDLMSLLGAGPTRKSKFSGNQSRTAAPLTRNSNTAGAGKPQTVRPSNSAAARQEQTGRPRSLEAAITEGTSAAKPVAHEMTATVVPAPRNVEHETGPDIPPAAHAEGPIPVQPAAETATDGSNVWRDELRQDAKEMTRAANYVASMLQQNKPLADVQTGSARLNDRARSFVTAVTEDAESPAVVTERVSKLQKAAGTLMRAADRAGSPEEALSFAQSKPQTASNAYLTRSMEAAAQREKERSADSVEHHRQAQPAPADATGEQRVQETNREHILEDSHYQPDQLAAVPANVAEGHGASSAGMAKVVDLPVAMAATVQPKTPATLRGTAGHNEARGSEHAQPQAEPDNPPAEYQSTSDAVKAEVLADDARENARHATAPAEELPRPQPRVERDRSGARPVQSGLKLRTAPAGGDHTARGAASEAPEERPSIESFLEEPPARSRNRQSQPRAETARRTSAPEQATTRTGDTLRREQLRDAPPAHEPQAEPSRNDIAADAGPVASSERSTLGAVLREHMAQRGFDSEAQRLAPTVASAVRDNGRFRSKEQSVVVLHIEGDRLATATTERSLPAVAMRSDSVLHAKTLEHIAEHGLDDAIVRALRNAAPHATGSLTSLEVADSVGAGFLGRAGEEGFPRELFEELREVSVEAQRQLSEQTDKTLAQQFALEQVSKRWGDERRSVDDVLRGAPAAAVQKLEQVAEEHRANAVAHHPAEPGTPEPQQGSAQKGEPARTFRFGGK